MTPRFSPHDPGPAEIEWFLETPLLSRPVLGAAALAARRHRVVVLAAHPDDETLAAAGLVHDLAAAGCEVEVVMATDGESSHPRSTVWPPDRLATVRRVEARTAVDAIAPTARLTHLGLTDGGLSAEEPELVAALEGRCDDSTLMLAPFTHDGHPDHDAAGRAAVTVAERRGAALLFYLGWRWHWEIPASSELPWSRMVLAEPSCAALNARRVALSAYPSQSASLGPGEEHRPVVTEPVLRRARRLVETYVVASGDMPTIDRADQNSTRSTTFDEMYDQADDPWGFEDSAYERRKRGLLMSVLADQRYECILEIGCADGVLTSDLAQVADQVTAMDVSEQALNRAGRRQIASPVRWVHGTAPDDVPDGRLDLVVLSEVGYFLTGSQLLQTLVRLHEALIEGAEVVLCHWQHPTSDIPLDGGLVHDQARDLLGEPRATYRDADVRIDVWGGAPPRP